MIFESDFLPEVAELTNLGLSDGHADQALRRRHGHLRDRTRGAGGDAAGPLRRPADPAHAGARLLVAAPELDGFTSLQVCGNEWVAHVTCRRQLIDELGVANGNGNGSAKGGGPPTHDVFHGMVARRAQSITSSKEGALLIDDLAEWLERRDRRPTRSAAEVRRAPPARRSDRAGAGRARLLPPAADTKRVDFEPEKLLREEQAASAGTWRGPRPTTAPARRCGGRARRRGPRLPLRRRPVGALPAPPAQRGRAARRRARWPATSPTSRAGTARSERAPRGRAGRRRRCSTQGVARPRTGGRLR